MLVWSTEDWSFTLSMESSKFITGHLGIWNTKCSATNCSPGIVDADLHSALSCTLLQVVTASHQPQVTITAVPIGSGNSCRTIQTSSIHTNSTGTFHVSHTYKHTHNNMRWYVRSHTNLGILHQHPETFHRGTGAWCCVYSWAKWTLIHCSSHHVVAEGPPPHWTPHW